MYSSKLTEFIKQKRIIDLIDEENFREVYKLCNSKKEFTSELTRLFLDCNIRPDDYMDKIPAYYLYKSLGLTSYAISDSVTSIGAEAFSSCTSLTSISIPDGVTSIGYDAFSGCTGLTSINIPDSVTSIGYGAFAGCSSLTSVTIGNGVTSIGDGAFYDCTSLASISIGNGVTSIGDLSFRGCRHLDINFNGSKAQWQQLALGKFSGSIYTCTCLDGVVKKSRQD